MCDRSEFANYWHLPELGGLELLNARYEEQAFTKHSHEGYCIAVIEDGTQTFQWQGSNYYANERHIVLINADEVHTGSPVEESGWEYHAIYPTPEMIAHINKDLFKQTGAPWFADAVVDDQALAQQLMQLFLLLEQEGNTLLKETFYLSTMAYLIAKHGQSPPEIQNLSDSKKQILWVKEFIYAYPEREFTLTELANMAHLSQWHFLRQFNQHVGMTPHKWLIQARLHKASRLLKQGLRPINIAVDCGFSDQSHFNRHFKKAFGVTPTQYTNSLFL